MFESPVATMHDVEQGSEEWLEIRLPLATASEFKNVLAKIGKGEAAARRNYRAELVVQRLMGKPIERFKSNAMQWGNDTEELAAAEYMLKTGQVAESCGIFVHNDHAIGDSPDRLVGLDGTVEIKCFEVANHIATLRSGQMPKEHKPQVQGHMWLTGRKWCDFVSFAPELPQDAQLFIQRQYRDEEYIAMLEAELILFLKEVDAEVDYIKNYKAPALVL